jgi:hypothetical protein
MLICVFSDPCNWVRERGEMVKLERGLGFRVHSNGNKETYVLFSRLQTERGQ